MRTSSCTPGYAAAKRDRMRGSSVGTKYSVMPRRITPATGGSAMRRTDSSFSSRMRRA
jgi:hypothetical protein